MNLKRRLFSQNMLVLLCTVVITSCISLAFGYFYTQANKIPTGSGAAHTDIIVLRGAELLYSTGGLSPARAQEIVMYHEMGQKTCEYNNMQYSLDVEEFSKQGDYRIIKLSPILNTSEFYQFMIGFVVVVFFITFLAASLVSQRYNLENIVRPIVNLKRQTELLSEGELDTAVPDEGEGEVRELCRSVEQLRLKLKESIYYQEKYDDNRKFLVSSISHDLRTPVTAIRGYVEGVLDGVADTAGKRERYLRAALDKTALMSSMIDDLLLYSKLDLNQLPFDMEKVDIAAYMEDCVADNRLAFEREDKTVSLQNGLDRPVQVIMDSARMRRVVQNILDNARRHIEPGMGAVTAELREVGATVIVECRDNGSGIPQKDLPHVFDRFYRADNARKAEGSSGLGLAIAKQMVEGMGGRIWATSEPGRGTSIMVSLRKARP